MQKYTIIKSKEASLALAGHELILATQGKKPRVAPLSYAVPASLMAEFLASTIESIAEKNRYEDKIWHAIYGGSVKRDDYEINPARHMLIAISEAFLELKLLKRKRAVFRGKPAPHRYLATPQLWLLTGGVPKTHREMCYEMAGLPLPS